MIAVFLLIKRLYPSVMKKYGLLTAVLFGFLFRKFGSGPDEKTRKFSRLSKCSGTI